MATGITTYQCPACTGPLHFVGESGRLECDYCGSGYEVAEIEALYAQKEQEAAEAQARREAREAEEREEAIAAGVWSEEEAANMKAYNCPSCGAELICDATTAATSCPYCGNPTVVPGQFAGGLKPDLIIPFKLDKEAAKAALQNYYKGKAFLPKAFRDQNHIEEIKGVYVPFWLYDCKVDGRAEYSAKRIRVFRTGDTEITETDHFRLSREGSVRFEKVPVDGSSKMSDAHMDSIEPFDYSELREFSTAYLPGFLADKYDQDQKECARRLEERAKHSASQALHATTGGYDLVTKTDEDLRVSRGKFRYALMPVWMLSTRWKGQSFLFAMNGQTGRFVGNLPVDKGKYWACFAGIALPLAAIMLLLLL